MKTKLVLALIAGVSVLLALTLVRTRPSPYRPQPAPAQADSEPPEAAPRRNEPRQIESTMDPVPSTVGTSHQGALTTNKVQRLSEIREIYHQLAAGDPSLALRAAKQLGDETERETALLTLVTEWTQGELRPARERARAIKMYGLEAGLGIGLAKNPALAVTWANELTEGPERTAVLQQAAYSLTEIDPDAAFALSEQLPTEQRRKFIDSIYAAWATKDTESALQWASQLVDPAERQAAVQAIRSEAPVGIGTAVTMRDGYPTVQQLLPGTPAELSGQIHPGDRIVALAQQGSAFVDAQNIPLSDLVQMLRGAPGTKVQLQVQSADAPPDSQPRTIYIIRDQIKFKR